MSLDSIFKVLEVTLVLLNTEDRKDRNLFIGYCVVCTAFCVFHSLKSKKWVDIKWLEHRLYSLRVKPFFQMNFVVTGQWKGLKAHRPDCKKFGSPSALKQEWHLSHEATWTSASVIYMNRTCSWTSILQAITLNLNTKL